MAAEKISKELYKGAVKIDFYPDSHRYKLAGRKDYLISATAITGVIDKSRFLIPWAINLAERFIKTYLENGNGSFTKEELLPVVSEACVQHTVKKEEAASTGSIVHDWVENFAQAKMNNTALPEIPENEAAQNGIGAFLDWFNANDVKFLHTERMVYSVDHDYVGITDAIAVVNGKRLVMDYKTSKGIYSEHKYQISGYWLAIEEEDKEELDGALLLHFDKETGEFDPVEINREEHELNYPVFLSLLTVKRREKELAKAY